MFTFREIQNWRQDSWSRDLLLTLLRTRTMVFCGYSTADPVLHDTFRTVYEEMASRFKRHAFAETGERRRRMHPLSSWPARRAGSSTRWKSCDRPATRSA